MPLTVRDWNDDASGFYAVDHRHPFAAPSYVARDAPPPAGYAARHVLSFMRDAQIVATAELTVAEGVCHISFLTSSVGVQPLLRRFRQLFPDVRTFRGTRSGGIRTGYHEVLAHA